VGFRFEATKVQGASPFSPTASPLFVSTDAPHLQGGAVRLSKVEPGVEIHAVSQQYKAEQDKANAIKNGNPHEHDRDEHVRHLEDIMGEVRLFLPSFLFLFAEKLIPTFWHSTRSSAKRCWTRWRR
jgi:hypothetical protein